SPRPRPRRNGGGCPSARTSPHPRAADTPHGPARWLQASGPGPHGPTSGPPIAAIRRRPAATAARRRADRLVPAQTECAPTRSSATLSLLFRHLFGHERHRQAKLGRAEVDRGKEGHLHRIEGPSPGQNELLVRTPWDALRMCAYWLCYQHYAVRVPASG